MRKLKLQMQVSLDGFVAGAKGEMDWMTFNWDEALLNYVTEITEPVDTIFLGRKLAEGFIPHWEAAAKAETAQDFEKKMHETPKVVFTKTLTENNWAYTQLAKGSLVGEIKKLKKQKGKDIIAYGGGNFVSNLIKNNLIEEYYIFVNPAALGKGMPIFKNLKDTLKLELVETKGFSCGVVVLCYKPIKSH